MLDRYALEGEERRALETGDVGLIYVLGANGQLLMHYAAFLGMPWADYIAAMRDGVAPPWAGTRRGVCNDHSVGRKGGGRMSLVFAGICSHAPGITGRAQLADRDIAGDFFRCYRSMGDATRGRKARCPDRLSPPSTSPISS